MDMNIGMKCACAPVDPEDIFKLYSALYWFGVAGPENVDIMKPLIKKALGIEAEDPNPM